MKTVWGFIRRILEFLVFMLVCTVFGKFSILIRYQNIGLIALLVISVVCVIFIKDIVQLSKYVEDEE